MLWFVHIVFKKQRIKTKPPEKSVIFNLTFLLLVLKIVFSNRLVLFLIEKPYLQTNSKMCHQMLNCIFICFLKFKTKNVFEKCIQNIVNARNMILSSQNLKIMFESSKSWFYENVIVSQKDWLRDKPRRHSNCLQWFVQKLSLSESESSYKTARLDRKEIENDWQDLEHRPKMWNFPTNKIGQNLGKDGPGAWKQYCFSSLVFTLGFKNNLYKPLSDPKTLGFSDAQTPRLSESQAPRLSDAQALGTTDSRTYKRADAQTPRLRLPDSRTPKLAYSQTPRLPDPQTPRLSDSQTLTPRLADSVKLRDFQMPRPPNKVSDSHAPRPPRFSDSQIPRNRQISRLPDSQTPDPQTPRLGMPQTRTVRKSQAIWTPDSQKTLNPPDSQTLKKDSQTPRLQDP